MSRLLHKMPVLSVLFLLFASAQGLALNLPGELSDDGISNSVTLRQNNAEQDQLQTPSPTSSPSSAANVSGNNASSHEERRSAMLYSIRQHIMAKLNLEEQPQGAPPNPDFELSPALLASYYAHVEALKQGAGAPEVCSEEETTHFSRHTKLYNPERFMPSEPNPRHFQLSNGDDHKGEETKHSDKDKDDGGLKTSSKSEEASSISPVLYNLRFGGLNFSDTHHLWSIKLQLYKRKATLGLNNKRGTNPVDAVKVFRVIRTFSYGQSMKKYVLLASMNVPSSEDDRYVSFNITSGVKNWLASSPDQTTLELDVQIDTPQRVDTGLSLPPAVVFDIPSHGKGEHNARLLVERLNQLERVGPNREHDNLFRRRKRQTVQGVNNEFCHDNPTTSSCCIRNLTIDFHELGLNQIVYPTVFQSNYCQGECRLNAASASRSTSFLMQLRETNPTAAPEPCCVAHKTRPLTVFMNLNGSVQLRDIPDMIVESCICR